ncbi:sensor histidine kinase [Streptomyces poriferorum]|uniref:histidine kinase n=1 Tax=Streptomyces poriferorum TaxID=2798799 RepID=A0ABY9J0G9_9ACTN|nr:MULTISPECIES: histidine kinase [unclassified Streptomyces]MDP5310313.1 histidine kinase [Streptomyces sp. Alt4]WLQ60529.1 histidine kinase [Streptomyces sp. Alt2]
MSSFLRPLTTPVTYTRWLHLLLPGAAVSVWLFISTDTPWVPVVLAALVGLIPGMRLAEGIQAQLLLTPDERGDPSATISVTPSTSWSERWRTSLWLEVRLLCAALAGMATVWLLATAVDLIRSAVGSEPSAEWFAAGLGTHWWAALLAPVPLVMLLAIIVSCGELITAAARWLLGPTRKQRMTALEERTEQLLERNRIARELHDSIGHALTVAVVQAGAARAAHDPEFTERALAAIEETGRDALDDLERVLRVLRESGEPTGQQPSLSEADRLLDSARGSGAEVDADLSGPLEQVPASVSREGYRILQEALTNVLRHSGSVAVRVRVRVRVTVADGRLELEVTNPLMSSIDTPLAGSTDAMGRGSGLRGIRERAALLGGSARTGPHEGEWRVHASLPLYRIR